MSLDFNLPLSKDLAIRDFELKINEVTDVEALRDICVGIYREKMVKDNLLLQFMKKDLSGDIAAFVDGSLGSQ